MLLLSSNVFLVTHFLQHFIALFHFTRFTFHPIWASSSPVYTLLPVTIPFVFLLFLKFVIFKYNCLFRQDETTLPNGQKFDLLSLALLGTTQFADRFHAVLNKLVDIKFDIPEYICFKFVILLNPGTLITVGVVYLFMVFPWDCNGWTFVIILTKELSNK